MRSGPTRAARQTRSNATCPTGWSREALALASHRRKNAIALSLENEKNMTTRTQWVVVQLTRLGPGKAISRVHSEEKGTRAAAKAYAQSLRASYCGDDENVEWYIARGNGRGMLYSA